MDNDTKPPPITDLLDQEWIQLLARLLTEVLADSGYGKVTISVYKKSVVGMDKGQSYRRGNDANN
jgi:hypothetical protein